MTILFLIFAAMTACISVISYWGFMVSTAIAEKHGIAHTAGFIILCRENGRIRARVMSLSRFDIFSLQLYHFDLLATSKLSGIAKILALAIFAIGLFFLLFISLCIVIEKFLGYGVIDALDEMLSFAMLGFIPMPPAIRKYLAYLSPLFYMRILFHALIDRMGGFSLSDFFFFVGWRKIRDGQYKARWFYQLVIKARGICLGIWTRNWKCVECKEDMFFPASTDHDFARCYLVGYCEICEEKKGILSHAVFCLLYPSYILHLFKNKVRLFSWLCAIVILAHTLFFATISYPATIAAPVVHVYRHTHHKHSSPLSIRTVFYCMDCKALHVKICRLPKGNWHCVFVPENHIAIKLDKGKLIEIDKMHKMLTPTMR